MANSLFKILRLWEALSQFPCSYTIWMVWFNKFLPGQSGRWLRPEVFPSSSPKYRLCFWHPIPQRLNAKNKNNNAILKNDGKISQYPCLLSTNAYWLPPMGQVLNLWKKSFFKVHLKSKTKAIIDYFY